MKQNWTSGVKTLRSFGFSIYSKTHTAFWGRLYYNGIEHIDIEINHSRETKLWKIEFCFSLGEDPFEVRHKNEILVDEVTNIKSLLRDFLDEVSASHFGELKVIRNIFFNNRD